MTDGGNPHQWYSQAAVRKFIERVAADLEAADPAHRPAIGAGRAEFEQTGLAEYAR